MLIFMRFAVPDGALIELKVLLLDAPKNHGSHTAVADGQGLHPLAGRFVIPQLQGIGAQPREGCPESETNRYQKQQSA
jgi:hypothetical protein